MAQAIKAKKRKKKKTTASNENTSVADSSRCSSQMRDRSWWHAMDSQDRHPKSLWQLAKASEVHPLLWGIEGITDVLVPESISWSDVLFEQNGRKQRNSQDKRSTDRAQIFANLLQPISIDCHDARHGLEYLATAHILAEYRSDVEPEHWATCLDRLMSLAEGAPWMHALHDAWEAQLIGAELPLTLAYRFACIPPLRQLDGTGISFLEESLARLLDDSGMLVEAPIDRMLPLLACWTRCQLLLGAMADMKLRKETRQRIADFLRFVVRVVGDRFAVPFELTLSGAAKSRTELLTTAARLTRCKAAKRAVLERLYPERRKAKSSPSLPLLVGDDGTTAIMQSDPHAKIGSLFVDFTSTAIRWEVRTRREIILSGAFHPRISIGGQEVAPHNMWRVLFSYTDDDLDLLELETDLGPAWCWQRKFILAKQDAFIYTADLVRGPEATLFEYQLPMPLGRQVTFAGAEDSRDCGLIGNGLAARLIPLSAPEWKCEPSALECNLDPAAVTVRTHVPSNLLYVPLFIDLNRKRIRQEVTWRRLSVAEHLARVPDDRAVGYRVQAGTDQWLIYRSFTRFGNRTVLGQNLVSEFFCARFRPDGATDPLVEVEIDDQSASLHSTTCGE